MRPTFAIIAFTVLSGAGYGIWFVLGIGLLPFAPFCVIAPPAAPGELSLSLCTYPALTVYLEIAGFVLVTAGLLCSLGHLGRPARAWRALSQWRTSWLSREGVASIATYVPAVAIVALPFVASLQARGLSPVDTFTPWLDETSWLRILGVALAIGCVATVWCTAHIYSSLKPIRAWHDGAVTPAYLALALHAGAVWTWALGAVPQALSAERYANGRIAILVLVVATSIVAGAIKLIYWRRIDAAHRIDTGRATGLDVLGTVRVFEAPHTEENYLTHEMGFALARKHARKLRVIALFLAFALPLALALVALAWPSGYKFFAAFAIVAAMLGLFVERWLFFAEARHAVIAYYGR
jgi:sulfite dehydrogenase (quinone) subunit SoeC